MEKIVPEYYREYGVYANCDKMLPNIYDGSLPVWRRLLYSAHEVVKNYSKSSSLVSHCMGNYHPHGDQSIYEAAVKLVQNGMMEGQGAWGNRLGQEPDDAAAMRYTQVRVSKIIEKIVMEFVDYVPFEPIESKPEPLILPTMYPLCLMMRYPVSNMGFGFKTVIPTYTIQDLHTRLMSLIEKKPVTIAPRVEGCSVHATPEEFEAILTKGEGAIKVIGNYTVSKVNKKVTIQGWYPSTNWQAVLSKIDSYKKLNLYTNGDIGKIDQTNLTNGTQIVFQVTKAKNKDEIFDNMVAAIKHALSHTVHYKMWAVTPPNQEHKKEVVMMSVDNMLLNSFRFYKSVFKRYLQGNIEDLEASILELSVIEAIRPHIGLLDGKTEPDKVITKLANLVPFTEEQIKNVIDKYKIRKLITVNTDKTASLNKKLEFERKLKCIDKETTNNYESILIEIGNNNIWDMVSTYK
jgi:DNA gyrase/topoisomerase IV subunit A